MSAQPDPWNDEVARFGDPPPKANALSGVARRTQFIEALRANPNEWAEYLPPRGRTAWAGASSTTQLKEIEPRLETTTRSLGDRQKCRIWARYVP